MTKRQARRLIRLYTSFAQHVDAYGRLSGDRSAQSKALWHMGEAGRLNSQIRDLIIDEWA